MGMKDPMAKKTILIDEKATMAKEMKMTIMMIGEEIEFMTGDQRDRK